ncbi:MAG: SDR family oxidoreductase [Chloroflexota bacterium]|nr:SDR family oxidoreductase [Chloroflexota bacterium]
MHLGLRDRVAIVGGASKGIGRATAKLLAMEGCRVVMAARNMPALEEAADMLRVSIQNKTGTRPQILAAQCDMSVESDIKRLVARTVADFGAIDILVNNAGGPPLGGFEQHDDEAWQHAFEANFMSVVRMVREALPYLKQSGQGRVINITSTAVREPIDGLILSNSVRLGTTGLAKSLSRELGQYGITVHNVAPGTTMTDRIRPLIEAQAKGAGMTFEQAREQRANRIPLRRIGEPEDVAAAVVFLASAQARQISGQTLLVDGGETRAV